ncbi:hypothetical protein Desde_1073 [Desulfitobacterium dehalogenans ATCC 51507]|uniref:Uncharacterized protein n=1 Tax=Desulfitobacterium dehalogenans (strain ATCC 51507 / DSM 9161 / JW/IU-DC1) TaxID=756499 RepID=I4A6C1_DESDJ|nr:hypothetical protein Desde_1073 [Desulfitobacterium dehalogenans ATCC 51507]
MVICKAVKQLCRCRLYKPIDEAAKVNCINCHRWAGKKCRDEAELLYEEQREHGWAEKMMRENRGVWFDV